MESLTLIPFKERPDLIAAPVFEVLSSESSAVNSSEMLITEIDPAFKGGHEFCSNYGVDPQNGANCVILEAKRGDRAWYVAALIPVGARMDIGGAVRRSVNARKLGVAPLHAVLAATNMEYGSITAIGLPADWTVLVDNRVAAREFVFLGSGKAKSKLRVPGAFFVSNARFTIFPNLGIFDTNKG